PLRPREAATPWARAPAAHQGFAELLAERARRGTGPGGDNGLGARDHAELLREAGFAAVGTVWQCGPSVVLAAVRGGGGGPDAP
ncbi:hypothetical protein ACFV5C_00725, partial [Streptomyces sp. NPDC059762]